MAARRKTDKVRDIAGYVAAALEVPVHAEGLREAFAEAGLVVVPFEKGWLAPGTRCKVAGPGNIFEGKLVVVIQQLSADAVDAVTVEGEDRYRNPIPPGQRVELRRDELQVVEAN